MAGKTIDQLPLTDTPTPTADPDPRGEIWYQFVQDIENLLATGRATYAEATLRGIQETVERTQRVTDGQRRAVHNIETAASRPRYASRRYEGWTRRS